MHVNDLPGFEAPGSQILHPGSRALFVQWEKLRNERPCPTRAELDLSALTAILPDVVLIERDHIRKGFRYRLAGTRVCDLFRENLTASNAFAGWDSFESDVIGKHFHTTVTAHQPTLMRLRLAMDTGQVVATEFLGLPIQASGGSIQIFGGFFPFRPAADLGHKRIAARELIAIRSIWTEHHRDLPEPRPTTRNFRVISGGLASS